MKMGKLEEGIGDYLANLDPGILDLPHPIESIKIRRIGLGESNLNLLVIINAKKFVVRVNMDLNSPDKSMREYESLRIVSHLGVAPRVFHYEPSKEYAGETFVILEYLEGKTLDSMEEIEDHTIQSLGNVVAQLHKSDTRNLSGYLRKRNSSKVGLLGEIEGRILYIKRKRQTMLEEDGYWRNLFERPFRLLKQKEFRKEPSYVLGHGDICPQNVIVSHGKLRLIDWEDLALIDPALEIAVIFDAFNFSEKQREAFLEAYQKDRNVHELRSSIADFLPFQMFGVFCWAVMHVYEIGEREMHDAFLKEQHLGNHIHYAQEMFGKCKNERIIDKEVLWDASGIFPKRYLSR